MIYLSFFNTVEFYIITAFIAAAVIGFAALPSRRGAARTFLYPGTLLYDVAPSEAGIVAEVDDHGMLTLTRFGLTLGDTGAYSLAVTIIGFDVTIDERISPGRAITETATAARVVTDCFGPERYHFHFRSEATGTSAAFYLNIRPGNRVERRLS